MQTRPLLIDGLLANSLQMTGGHLSINSLRSVCAWVAIGSTTKIAMDVMLFYGSQSHPHPPTSHELLLVRLNQQALAEESSNQSKAQKASSTFAVK